MPRFGLHGAPASYLHPGQLPGLGAGPADVSLTPQATTIRVGGALFAAPALPSGVVGLSQQVAQLARLPISEATLRSAVGRAQGIAGTAAAAMGGDMAGALASAAAMVPPPYGPMIAIGASVAGMLVSAMFSDEPPKPQVGGRDVDAFPFASANDGALSGKISSGEVGAEELLKQGVVADASTVVQATLEMLARGKTIGQADVMLRAGQRMGGGSLPRTSFRSVAYFCAYAKFSDLYAMGGVNLWRKQIGKVLGWAAPRVQIREMFWYWYLYRTSLAAYAMWDGNPAGNTSRVAVRTTPVPGADFHPEAFRQGRAWPGSRRLAGKDAEVAGPDDWADLVRSRAAPLPVQDEKTGLWTYLPLDEGILAAEVAKYDRGALQLISDVPLSGLDRDEWVVQLPNMVGDGRGNYELTNFPESYAEAAKLCKALVAADKYVATPGRTGTSRGYVGQLGSLLSEMSGARIGPAAVALFARISQARANRQSRAARPGPVTIDKPKTRPRDPERDSGTASDTMQAGAGGGLLLLGGLAWALSKLATPRRNPTRRSRGRIRRRIRRR